MEENMFYQKTTNLPTNLQSEILQSKIESTAHIPLKQLLLAPKMCDTCVLGLVHRKKIKEFCNDIAQNGNKLPTHYTKDIILSYTRGYVQVHDGNHRLIALAFQNPNATVANISDHIEFIHDTELNEPRPYYFHILTNFQKNVKFDIIEDSKDGKVKCINSKSPIFFRDETIFKRKDYKIEGENAEKYIGGNIIRPLV